LRLFPQSQSDGGVVSPRRNLGMSNGHCSRNKAFLIGRAVGWTPEGLKLQISPPSALLHHWTEVRGAVARNYLQMRRSANAKLHHSRSLHNTLTGCQAAASSCARSSHYTTTPLLKRNWLSRRRPCSRDGHNRRVLLLNPQYSHNGRCRTSVHLREYNYRLGLHTSFRS